MTGWCGGLLLGLLVLEASAAAKETPAAAAQAKQHYEEGESAYQDGRYAEAIRAFSAADELAPRPALSFDIARAYERLGEGARAADYYREYLRRAPDAENAATVRQRIAELDAAREPAQAAAPTSFVAAAPAPSPATTPGPPGTTADRRSTFAPWSWVSLATGGALIAGAGIAEFARRDAESDARNAPTQLAYEDQYRRMQKDQTVARVLLGVGSALVVTGGVLIAVDLGRGQRAATRVACLPAACFGSVEGSF